MAKAAPVAHRLLEGKTQKLGAGSHTGKGDAKRFGQSITVYALGILSNSMSVILSQRDGNRVFSTPVSPQSFCNYLIAVYYFKNIILKFHLGYFIFLLWLPVA